MCHPAGAGVLLGSWCGGGRCPAVPGMGARHGGTVRHEDARGLRGWAAWHLILARSTAGHPAWPCLCCGPGILSAPVLAACPRDSRGAHGAMPRDGSTCSGWHMSFHSPAWRVLTVPGQPELGKGAWKFSLDEHLNSEVYSMLVQHEQGWKL